jgi:nucleoside-diphosphate-sugar epimerase
MKKILILGGTKYAGNALLKDLMKSDNYQITVLSRHKIEGVFSIQGDRKNTELLSQIFKHKYDFVIDFICFCLPDAQKLLNTLKINGAKPKIIFISTTYVYDQNTKNEIFTELDFNPLNYHASILERSEISYQEGKRSAEAYLSINYKQEDLCILRFPIILGKNDYTLRTNFFIDFFNKGGRLNQIKSAGASNFIFVKDIVYIMLKLIENFESGIFNVVRSEYLDQRDLGEIYFKILGTKNISKKISPPKTTPFYYNKNFKIDGSKLSKILPLKDSFFSRLNSIIQK